MINKVSKKTIMIGAVVLLLVVLVVGGVFAYMKMMEKPAPTTKTAQKKRITDPVNIVDQSQRPFLEIKPIDEHNMAIVFNQVKKPATSMHYELEYQTDTS